MAYAAPPELGELSRKVFYKHYAPLALQNLGIRQQYPNCARTITTPVEACTWQNGGETKMLGSDLPIGAKVSTPWAQKNNVVFLRLTRYFFKMQPLSDI